MLHCYCHQHYHVLRGNAHFLSCCFLMKSSGCCCWRTKRRRSSRLTENFQTTTH